MKCNCPFGRTGRIDSDKQVIYCNRCDEVIIDLETATLADVDDLEVITNMDDDFTDEYTRPLVDDGQADEQYQRTKENF